VHERVGNSEKTIDLHQPHLKILPTSRSRVEISKDRTVSGHSSPRFMPIHRLGGAWSFCRRSATGVDFPRQRRACTRHINMCKSIAIRLYIEVVSYLVIHGSSAQQSLVEDASRVSLARPSVWNAPHMDMHRRCPRRNPVLHHFQYLAYGGT
jgi:hypothetical protein